jgi:hypothetical protein
MTITIPSRLSEGELTAAVSRCSRDCFDPQGAFLGAGNHRCSERAFLEYHHVLPYAAGGEATPANIQLRCRAHNAHEADLFCGPGRKGEAGVVREAPAKYAVSWDLEPVPERVRRSRGLLVGARVTVDP